MLGKDSPWGRIDWARELAPGVWSVSTPGHGGIFVAAEALERMPEAIRRVPTFVERTGAPAAGRAVGRWYEEDCDAALVALAFPELFPREYLRVARTIGAKAHVAVAWWLDSLPANHPVNCFPGVPAVEAPADASEFQLTGSDRAADAPGQGGLF